MPTWVSFCGDLNGSRVAFKMESLPLEFWGFIHVHHSQCLGQKLPLKTLNNVLLIEGLLLNLNIQIIPSL